MLRAHEELWSAVPDRHDDLVTGEERLQGLVNEASEPQVADLDDARGGDEDVRGFQVAMEDVARVQVHESIQELIGEGLENGKGYRCT